MKKSASNSVAIRTAIQPVNLPITDINKLEMVKKLIDIYKEEFGHGWESSFANSVNIYVP